MQKKLFALAALGLLSAPSMGQTSDTACPRLELSTLDDGRYELTIDHGPAWASAWLVGAHEPRELVRLRAGLEGLSLERPAGLSVRLVHLDALGRIRVQGDPEELAPFQQAVVFEHPRVHRPQFTNLVLAEPQAATGSFSGIGAGTQSGFVVVTEFMKDPASISDTQGEWFEVQCLGPHRTDLEGMVISDDGTNAHLVYVGGTGLVIGRGRRMVFGRNPDLASNGDVQLDYTYTGITLGNGTDQIVLTARNGTLLDRVAYDDASWPDTAGFSVSLMPGAEHPLTNDDPANWCHSQTIWSAGNPDTGTPGFLNDVCP